MINIGNLTESSPGNVMINGDDPLYPSYLVCRFSYTFQLTAIQDKGGVELPQRGKLLNYNFIAGKKTIILRGFILIINDSFFFHTTKHMV